MRSYIVMCVDLRIVCVVVVVNLTMSRGELARLIQPRQKVGRHQRPHPHPKASSSRHFSTSTTFRTITTTMATNTEHSPFFQQQRAKGAVVVKGNTFSMLLIAPSADAA